MPQTDTGDNLICGFIKVKNEIIRCGNIYRAINNMSEYCDAIYAVDDASIDGTYEYLLSQLPEENIIRVDPKDSDFRQELYWKQKLIELIHQNGPWGWIWWADGDEVLDAQGTAGLRDLCRKFQTTNVQGFKFHYIQLWVRSLWYRLDNEFNNGYFIKLWRYNPSLRFDVTPGTHKPQFPTHISIALQSGNIRDAGFEVIHYGNYSSNLKLKCIMYANGLGGVDRHLRFENGSYAKIEPSKFPSGAEHSEEDEPQPKPFTPDEINKILKMNNLKNLKKTFAVTISTYNRAKTLGRAIDSVLAQTYQDFVIFVVDDGSTDNTAEVMKVYQEKDPRIFYCRYLENRGGVAVNEIACDLAVDSAEYWTRLGSDDVFFPEKLEHDFKAFEAGHNAVYGPFIDHNAITGEEKTIGNTPYPPSKQRACFETPGGFIAGWACFAVRTSILKQVKDKYGRYNDPRLRNMDDLLLNYRVCKVTPWIWRGIFADEFFINPPEDQMHFMTENKQASMKPDAFWNMDPKGASADGQTYANDSAIIRQIITEEKNK